MAEILAGGSIYKAFRELGIEAKRTYKSAHEPYYQVWEIDKQGIHALEEAEEWDPTWGFWRMAKGSNMGSAASFLTVNGEFMIGWETVDGKDTYDSLMDYFHDGLSVYGESEMCMLAVDLGRANGKTMSGVFATYEG